MNEAVGSYGNSFLFIEKLFSTVAASLIILTSNIKGTQFLHIFTNTCFFTILWITAMLGHILVTVKCFRRTSHFEAGKVDLI